MSEVVRYEASNGIATVTLNRPENLNAMNAALLRGAVNALEDAAADPGIRVVILTGAGRGFCAGSDLAASDTLDTGNTESRIGVLQTLQRSSKLLREMPKVTVAAINGPCAGGGLAPVEDDTAGRFLERRAGDGGYILVCQVDRASDQYSCRENAAALDVKIAYEGASKVRITSCSCIRPTTRRGRPGQ